MNTNTTTVFFIDGPWDGDEATYLEPPDVVRVGGIPRGYAYQLIAPNHYQWLLHDPVTVTLPVTPMDKRPNLDGVFYTPPVTPPPSKPNSDSWFAAVRDIWHDDVTRHPARTALSIGMIVFGMAIVRLCLPQFLDGWQDHLAPLTSRPPESLPTPVPTPVSTPVSTPVPSLQSLMPSSHADQVREDYGAMLRRAEASLPAPTPVPLALRALPAHTLTANMPYGGPPVPVNLKGILPNQEALPLSGNQIGDAYIVGPHTFVWVAPGGVQQWIDPVISSD